MSERRPSRPLCGGIIMPGPDGNVPSAEDMRKLGFVLSKALGPSRDAQPRAADEVAVYATPLRARR
jgi:hypothetical protein